MSGLTPEATQCRPFQKGVGRPNMIRTPGFALVVGVLASACASTPVSPHPQLEGVTLVFDHFGAVVDPLEQRMAETGQLQAAHEAGTDYWLRLVNNSEYVLTFLTFSVYITKSPKWFDLGDGRRVIALEDGAEIALPFGLESRRGREIRSGSGIDMFWTSFLPPRRSAVFNVPRKALKHERKVYVEYQKALKPSGTSYRTYFEAPRSPNSALERTSARRAGRLSCTNSERAEAAQL